jgi:hypothetical protein
VKSMNASESEQLVDGKQGHSYLTRCVAIVSLLHERGVLDELLESGRITVEEVDARVEIMERNFPGFKTLAVGNNEDK